MTQIYSNTVWLYDTNSDFIMYKTLRNLRKCLLLQMVADAVSLIPDEWQQLGIVCIVLGWFQATMVVYLGNECTWIATNENQAFAKGSIFF